MGENMLYRIFYRWKRKDTGEMSSWFQHRSNRNYSGLFTSLDSVKRALAQVKRPGVEFRVERSELRWMPQDV